MFKFTFIYLSCDKIIEVDIAHFRFLQKLLAQYYKLETTY